MDPINRAGASQAPLTAEQETSLKKLREAAQQLEGVFVGLLFKQMRASAPTTSVFGKVSEREKTFNEMLDTARADAVGKSGAFGFAKAIEAQLRDVVLGTRRSPADPAGPADKPATATDKSPDPKVDTP
jgi:Rod binding domain-containing protein